MDASASPKVNVDINGVYGLLLTAFDTNKFPMPMNQRSTIVKYTKLPDFEIESKVSWPPTCSLPPRVRRIVTLDDVDLKTNRSLKLDYPHSMDIMASNYTKRKIVTIAEDDENDLHPKFSREKRTTPKTSNRTIGIDCKEEKQMTQRTTSRLTNSSKYSKDTKACAKTNNANKKELNVIKQNYRRTPTNNQSVVNTKSRFLKDKELGKHPKPSSISSRSSLSKGLATPIESDKDLSFYKSKLYINAKTNEPFKNAERIKRAQSPPSNKNKSYFKELQSKSQPFTVIHVPLDDKYRKQCGPTPNMSVSSLHDPVAESNSIDRGTDAEVVDFKDVNIGTNPSPNTVDRNTDMDNFEMNAICKCIDSTVQTQFINETYESLEIPNVTLTKDKTECKDDAFNYSNSVQNLKIPPVKITPRKEELDAGDIRLCENASYVINRATLTYTTTQKIDFHVLGSKDIRSSNQPPSPLVYPVNVVSVLKNELSKQSNVINTPDDTDEKKIKSNTNYMNCLNELKSLNCSYIFNSNKLMKPSDIISTIRVNNGLLPNDYVCEQFQRELNFIDSFFESLQYLESCSFTDKCFTEDKEGLVHNPALFDSRFEVKNSEYDNFLSKIENGANIDDTETMASKSLCLLNLLIRDEQRRAKNLLFVLKMREDALKDFTKSQILWLEKKKKLDNTDISTLKKKQRGALLKLQQECGEMQRMRKALLALSEKRKVALMKTKKNIELKLKSNVDVEQIIFGKKKLKRNTPTDRNTAPLKCFDLSSSGCEDSITSRPHSEVPLLAPEAPAALITTITSAEKSIQTGDSILGTVLVDESTDTAAENLVVVDGGYLNILFHNMTLPEIFSNGKQYEVNEEALKDIVNTTNNHNNNFNGCDIVEKLMEQIKKRDLDRSSSPSTARSLVDEFDQYYKGLVDEDKSAADSSEKRSPDKVCEINDIYANAPDLSRQSDECNQSSSTMTSGSGDDILINNTPLNAGTSCGCDPLVHMEGQCQTEKDLVLDTRTPTGPLPVPVGAAASPDSPTPDIPAWLSSKSSDSTSPEIRSSQPLYESVSSILSLSSPVQCEAEELRRQQLAIEREIKALEQQQCRLLVVREIPDKPPPPYTPPAEPRPHLPRVFTADKSTDDKIENYMTNHESPPFDPTDPFDAFLKDFCHETLERHKQELSDYPWDACNLLPQKQQDDNQKLTEKTSLELKEILSVAIPTVVSGFSSRRSDHIDDILFTEWRRCEPEWTTLHTDEAIVKNQLFESIFQKILSDTIDEYRRTVQCDTQPD